jgi:hypothetical protein
MRVSTAAAAIVIASLSLAAPAHADGISLLVQVTQIKADNANDEAMESADRQRELIRQQQAIREQQRRLEEAQRETPTASGALQADSRVMLCRTCVAQTTSGSDDEDDD